jgi:transcriptional regulator with XRE-family HTH domain
MRYVKWCEMGPEIARIQKASGLNVKAFGERHGLSRPAMSNIVNGKKRPSEDLLKTLGIELYAGVPAKSARQEK